VELRKFRLPRLDPIQNIPQILRSVESEASLAARRALAVVNHGGGDRRRGLEREYRDSMQGGTRCRFQHDNRQAISDAGLPVPWFFANGSGAIEVGLPYMR